MVSTELTILRPSIADLAVACTLFSSLTSYNDSLRALHDAVGEHIDLTDQAHRLALLKWLNGWGCRHLSIAEHSTASQSIQKWFQSDTFESIRALEPLWILSDDRMETVGKAYASLKEMPGAYGTRKGKDRTATVGPTAASKVLFALHPESLPPWDEKMRKYFGCDGSQESYVYFLKAVRDLSAHVRSLCERNGFSIDELPYKLGRQGSTVVSLLNEYLWVTISAGCTLPSRDTLAKWAQWS